MTLIFSKVSSYLFARTSVVCSPYSSLNIHLCSCETATDTRSATVIWKTKDGLKTTGLFSYLFVALKGNIGHHSKQEVALRNGPVCLVQPRQAFRDKTTPVCTKTLSSIPCMNCAIGLVPCGQKENLPSLVLIFSKKLYILLISRLACSIRSPMSSGTGVICDRPQNKRSVSTMFKNSKSLANSVFGTMWKILQL